MNLTRQPLLKDAHNFFRFTRGHVRTIQHNRGDTICKQSMSSNTEKEANPSVLTLSHEDDELIKSRFALKKSVENVIRHRFGNRFQVEFFGSIHYGVSHPKSDLDLVVTDSRLPQGFKKPHGLGAIYNIEHIAHTLSRVGFTEITSRANASVPIVKFRDPASGLDCDLNVNDRLGIANSAMIKEYCDAHPFLRPLLYRIKEWAKPLGLNSPSPPGGPISFSSYALTLMTISFLQKEGHLPNLQDLPPISDSEALIWSRKPHKAWDARFLSAKDWVPPPLPDFDTLLSSWFSFWISFPYETESISVRHGGTTPRLQTVVRPISVIDPFIVTKVGFLTMR